MKNVEEWGGFAFPVADTCGHDQGMTLRDYFAAAALTGICASAACSKANPTYATVAVHAYAQADAMIAARTKPPRKAP